MRTLPILSTVYRASPRKRLWLAGGGAAVFLLTAVVGNGLIAADRAVGRADLGRDFLAFYTGAAFVRDGRYHQLYDLDAVRRAEAATAAAAGIDLGTAFGPWWNPPVYALALSPLARLPYGTALDVWRWANVAALVGAAAVLGRMPLRRRARPPGSDGLALGSAAGMPADYTGTAALALLLLATSMPFVQAIGHAQNTCTSLLLLTATVGLWRADRAVWAGIIGGLLFYKPQLAAVVAGVMAVDLGWAAVAGLAFTGVALLAIQAAVLPGSLGDWLHGLPANVHWIQVDRPYLWDRHVTLKAFWRLLLQGTPAGEPWPVTTVLTDASVAAVAAALAWATWRARGRADCRDRLIAATVVATPLLMPFYFDYDLLLLAVPAVLYAADADRDRRLTAAWVVLAAELYVNAPLAGRLHVIPAVVLLAGISAAMIRRVNRMPAAASRLMSPPAPLAVAA